MISTIEATGICVRFEVVYEVNPDVLHDDLHIVMQDLCRCQLTDLNNNVPCYSLPVSAIREVLDNLDGVRKLGTTAISRIRPMGFPKSVAFEAFHMLVTSGIITWKYNWLKLSHQELRNVSDLSGHVHGNDFNKIPSISNLVPRYKSLISAWIAASHKLHRNRDVLRQNTLSYFIRWVIGLIANHQDLQQLMVSALCIEGGHVSSNAIVYNQLTSLRQQHQHLGWVTLAEFVKKVMLYKYEKDTILGYIVIYAEQEYGNEGLMQCLVELDMRWVPRFSSVSGLIQKKTLTYLSLHSGHVEGIRNDSWGAAIDVLLIYGCRLKELPERPPWFSWFVDLIRKDKDMTIADTAYVFSVYVRNGAIQHGMMTQVQIESIRKNNLIVSHHHLIEMGYITGNARTPMPPLEVTGHQHSAAASPLQVLDTGADEGESVTSSLTDRHDEHDTTVSLPHVPLPPGSRYPENVKTWMIKRLSETTVQTVCEELLDKFNLNRSYEAIKSFRTRNR